MNTQTRQKAAELVRNEFKSRKSALQEHPTEKQVSNQMKLIISRLGIGKKIERINKLEEEANRLRQEVGEKVFDLYEAAEGIKNKRGRKSSCECYVEFEFYLDECAKADAKAYLGYDEQWDSLDTTERKTLAAVLTCSSNEEMTALLKKVELL